MASLTSKALFTPLRLRSVVLKNRIGVSPMCQYSAIDGFPNDWHLSHLSSRATGGASLVIAEATGVLPEGRISPGCTGIWSDAHVEPWKRVVNQIKANGAVAGIQIGHAGRKASTHKPWVKNGGSLESDEGSWLTVGPSPIPFGMNITHQPKEATKEDIKKVKEAFIAATRRALEAGFEVLEIHAAHGYLLDEFLSPLSNKRTDEYGGSLENRARLLLEVVKDVRTVWPETLPLFVRISVIDWAEGGKTEEDSVYVSKKLKEAGVDLIDCSSGFVVPETMKNIKFGPGFQTRFSQVVKAEADIPTAAVGGITNGPQMEEILNSKKADLILVGTQFLRDPFLAYHSALELGVLPKEAASVLPPQTGFWLQKTRLEMLQAKTAPPANL